MKEIVVEPTNKSAHQMQIIWSMVFKLSFLHVCTIYALYILVMGNVLKTFVFNFIFALLCSVGLTAGYHRLWAHRSYKARLPLRIFLWILCTAAAQGTIYKWCRDHRVHHKHTETDADPHNIKRGFFFAHVGWMLLDKHPEVLASGRNLDLRDLLNDPIIRFDMKFNIAMVLLFNLCLPTMIPVLYWGETLLNALILSTARYTLILHATWLVNSAAHSYGSRPYNKHAEARENSSVSLIAMGEGWHNYHHVFPWDYAASELGYHFNISKVFIDFMAFIGQAYDLKSPTPEMVKYEMVKRGDGTRMEGRYKAQESLVD